MQQRRAAITSAVSLLKEMVEECGMDALDVAGMEAQLHGLGYTLGMGSASDVPDPLVAA